MLWCCCCCCFLECSNVRNIDHTELTALAFICFCTIGQVHLLVCRIKADKRNCKLSMVHTARKSQRVSFNVHQNTLLFDQTLFSVPTVRVKKRVWPARLPLIFKILSLLYICVNGIRRLTHVINSFFPQAIKLWNHLPQELTELESFKLFIERFNLNVI